MTIQKIITAALILAFSWTAPDAPAQAKDPIKKQAPNQAKKAKPAVLATVNGAPVSRESYDYLLTQITQGEKIADPARLSKIREKVMDHLIVRELLFAQSVKQNIKISDPETEQKIKEMENMSGETLEDHLKSRGISREFLKHFFTRSMAIERLIKQDIIPGVTVPEKEVRELYDRYPEISVSPERVRASHILIQSGPHDSQAALEKIRGIREELRKGADFAGLARKHSQCPSGKKGGDLDFFTQGQMARPFSKAAFSLKPGEISDIVKTRFGYHIIKATDRKPASKMGFEDIKDRVSGFLKQKKEYEAIEAYGQRLKEKADIRRMDRTD
ncbi:putative Peptidylprolyl isomerase [Candidatus Desulfarcum epimagneticum]|uniref:Putative Peptidylprolyl isomerase n=1 Tax=uncultured Desulfobacteraceae bacterium TaxID=218296 RepID=A0A484HNF2_9BACT|nr:putative Peptidylprolyl isomerase [uncultured Desulfobacteraceae bacterium]